MDVTYSLSNPYQIFLSEELLEEIDVEQGKPVELEVCLDDQEISLAAPVNHIGNIDGQDEEYALFSTLPQISNSLPEGVLEEFRDTLIKDSQVFDIQGPYELGGYIHDIKREEFHKYRKADVVIGIGLLDIIYQFDRINNVKTPFAFVPEKLLIKCFEGIDIDLEFQNGNFEVEEPESVLFCTHGHELPRDIRDELTDKLTDAGFITYGINLRISAGPYFVHGPVMKESPSEFDKRIYKLTEENIQFNCASRIPIVTSQDSEFETGEVMTMFEEEFEEFEVYEREDNDLFTFEIDAYFFSVEIHQNTLQIDLFHAFEDEKEEFVSRLRAWLESPDPNLPCDFEISEVHQHSRNDALLNDIWVLDTNTVYKQFSRSNATDICKFIFDEPRVFNKTLKIPWQVIGEINRHKDGSSTLAGQGLQNLKSVKNLDEYGYLDLDLGSLPDNFDNSVHPDTGITDLGILSSVPDDGVLLTNDEELNELAKMFEIPVEDVVRTDSTSEADLWKEVKSELEDGYQEIETIKESIESTINSERATPHQDRFEEPDAYIRKWGSDNRIIRSSIDGDDKVALTKRFEITPTYRTIKTVSDNISKLDIGMVMTGDFLEDVRGSIGRLPTGQFPKIEFVIPEQYVYRAKEVGQVQELRKITQLNNADYRSESVNLERSSIQSALDEAAVKTAQETGSILLCDSSEEDLKMLSSLINVDAVTL